MDKRFALHELDRLWPRAYFSLLWRDALKEERETLTWIEIDHQELRVCFVFQCRPF